VAGWLEGESESQIRRDSSGRSSKEISQGLSGSSDFITATVLIYFVYCFTNFNTAK